MSKKSDHRFSVVIPARNEENYIRATINSIKNQDFDGFVEIIVVDNASIDKTSNKESKSIYRKCQSSWA